MKYSCGWLMIDWISWFLTIIWWSELNEIWLISISFDFSNFDFLISTVINCNLIYFCNDKIISDRLEIIMNIDFPSVIFDENIKRMWKTNKIMVSKNRSSRNFVAICEDQDPYISLMIKHLAYKCDLWNDRYYIIFFRIVFESLK